MGAGRKIGAGSKKKLVPVEEAPKKGKKKGGAVRGSINFDRLFKDTIAKNKKSIRTQAEAAPKRKGAGGLALKKFVKTGSGRAVGAGRKKRRRKRAKLEEE